MCIAWKFSMRKDAIMKRLWLPGLISIYAVLLGLLITSCTGSNPVVTEGDDIVVQAYLFAHEPVDDNRLTSTVALDAESGQSPPVNDAQVALVKGSQRYALTPSPGDSGYYHYPGNDLFVEEGDHFTLEIQHNNRLITGETVVPEPPVNVALSSTVLDLFDPADSQFGTFPDLESLTVEVSWDNEEGALFYLVIENIEQDPEAIEISFKRPQDFISQPTQQDSFRINQGMVTHLGRHLVHIYRINQEYADLYESREQDSRDLNEPLTNINNSLGVFSAFNSQTVLFEVIE